MKSTSLRRPGESGRAQASARSKWVLFAGILAITIPLVWAQALGSKLNVQVRSCQLRDKPSLLSKVVAEVKYGEQLTLLETSVWYKVQKGPEEIGWVHPSALTPKRIELKPDTEAKASASRDDVVYASKGFNQQVETTYRNAYPTLGYRWIDEMEKQHATPEEVAKFVQDGNLIPSIGGGQ